MARRSAVVSLGTNKPLLLVTMSKMALASGVVVPIPTFLFCEKAVKKIATHSEKRRLFVSSG